MEDYALNFLLEDENGARIPFYGQAIDNQTYEQLGLEPGTYELEEYSEALEGTETGLPNQEHLAAKYVVMNPLGAMHSPMMMTEKERIKRKATEKLGPTPQMNLDDRQAAETVLDAIEDIGLDELFDYTAFNHRIDVEIEDRTEREYNSDGTDIPTKPESDNTTH